MQAKETLFADLVQGRAQQFQVPLYQRTYSWTEKQLRQLWGDILEQAGLLEREEKASTHFLGSVVLAPSPQNDATFPRWLVVDSQQRLTTLSLALAAIRDHIRDAEPGEAERIDEQYLINKWKGGSDHFRLLPTQADRPQFAAHVRGPRTEQSTGGSVNAAYGFFRRKLVEAADPAAPQDVFRIEQAITSRLTLVAVTAERGDNVHRIFESLNNTGLKLSQADLLRNYLFMKLHTLGEQVYETYWLPLQDSLSNEELEQLMWLQLVLDGNDRVRRQDLYASQQQRFEHGEASEEEIEAYIRGAVPPCHPLPPAAAPRGGAGRVGPRPSEPPGRLAGPGHLPRFDAAAGPARARRARLCGHGPCDVVHRELPGAPDDVPGADEQSQQDLPGHTGAAPARRARRRRAAPAALRRQPVLARRRRAAREDPEGALLPVRTLAPAQDGPAAAGGEL
ncbi:DUF262 domain-containing protein [Streptomyces sp. NPDC026672]|uniref:DUF262 domain-containing protein n=1 Tax=unclassified Streptomyces TaxID=2593676 RepID=UPI003402D9F9